MPDKGTYRDHLLVIYRQTGNLPEELANEPILPESIKHVWEFFIELNSARGSNGFGGNPITYSDLGWWSSITGNKPSKWEIAAIIRIDSLYREFQAKAANAGSTK